MKYKKCAVLVIIAIMGVVYGNFVFVTTAVGFGLNETWCAGVSGYIAGTWVAAGVMWVR